MVKFSPMDIFSAGSVVLYLLGIWGVSYSFSTAKIGQPVRVIAAFLGDGWLDFIRCPACTGWWVGSLVGWGFCREVWGDGRLTTYAVAILGGFACCGFNRIVYGLFIGEPLGTESDGGTDDHS